MEADIPGSETIEVEGETIISIGFARRWPKYAVTWSARVKRSDSDYPLAADIIETMPRTGSDPDAIWADLRDRAMSAAHAAIAARQPAAPARKPGLLSRLFGRD